MTSPLSPVREASLNRATPPSKRKYDQYEVHASTASTITAAASATTRRSESPRSSPLVFRADETTTDPGQENMSPSKSRHSRVMSGTELSPLRILAAARDGPAGGADMGPPPQRGARRMQSPVSRFPVKVGGARDGDAGARAAKERKLSVERGARDREGLRTPMEVLEDERSGLSEEGEGEGPDISVLEKQQHEHDHEHGSDEAAAPDDSMVSTFSTFSVVPNLTVFANLGRSPAKHSAVETPRAKLRQVESLARPPSSSGSHGSTSNLLMDFTDQMRFPHKSPGKRASLSP
ncbi:hypothetical protein E4U42_000414, partial [Claviceps africana]